MNVSLYKSATTVAALEESGVPALIHRRATDAVQTTVHPWIAANSSQPRWTYKWWAALPMSVLGHKARDDVRAAGAEALCELVFLESEMTRRLPEVIDRCRARNPVKGYKDALCEMRSALSERLAIYRADSESYRRDLIAWLS